MLKKVAIALGVLVLMGAMFYFYRQYTESRLEEYAAALFAESRTVQDVIDRLEKTPPMICDIVQTDFSQASVNRIFIGDGWMRLLTTTLNDEAVWHNIVYEPGNIYWVEGDEYSRFAAPNTYFSFAQYINRDMQCRSWTPDSGLLEYPPFRLEN